MITHDLSAANITALNDSNTENASVARKSTDFRDYGTGDVFLLHCVVVTDEKRAHLTLCDLHVQGVAIGVNIYWPVIEMVVMWMRESATIVKKSTQNVQFISI